MPSKAAFNYFLVPEGGQGASFSRGAALAPVVAVLCCAPKMLQGQGTSESYLASLSLPLPSHLPPHSLGSAHPEADLLCQPAKQGSLQLFFWFLKGVREPHFPEVQPWLLWLLCFAVPPRMLQGASESYLASLSCLCQAIFLHIPCRILS